MGGACRTTKALHRRHSRDFLTFTTQFWRSGPHPPMQNFCVVLIFWSYMTCRIKNYPHSTSRSLYASKWLKFQKIDDFWNFNLDFRPQNRPKLAKPILFHVLGRRNTPKHRINMIFCSRQLWHPIFQIFGDPCMGGGAGGCGLKRQIFVVKG